MAETTNLLLDSEHVVQKLLSTGKELAGVAVSISTVSPDNDGKGKIAHLTHAAGMTVTDITDKILARLPAPSRRKGHLTMLSPKSLVDYINRYVVKGQTAIFADSTNRKVVAVLNYHQPTVDAILDGSAPELGVDLDHHEDADVKMPETTAQWGDFRASYAFPLSRQWNAWKKIDGAPQPQFDLARFLEDNIRDVADPGAVEIPDSVQLLIDRLNLSLGTPSRLLEVARGMEINSTENVRTAINTSTGEQVVSYEQAHTNGGNPTVNELRVPTGFLLAVPVFQNDDPYLLLCRLRYRKEGSSVKWIVNIQGADAALEDAFARGCDTIQQGTGVPLFFSEHPAAGAV